MTETMEPALTIDPGQSAPAFPRDGPDTIRRCERGSIRVSTLRHRHRHATVIPAAFPGAAAWTTGIQHSLMDWPRIVRSFCSTILALPAPAVRPRIRSRRRLTTQPHSSMHWDLHTSMSSVSRSADTSRRPLRSATPNSHAGSFLSAPSPVRATTEIGTPMSTTLLPETKCSLSRTSVPILRTVADQPSRR